MKILKIRHNIVILIVVIGFIAAGVYYTYSVPNNSARYTYLAIGDSYTVGTGISYADNYPNQVVHKLRSAHVSVNAPYIVAGPGWTTSRMLEEIGKFNEKKQFSFVSILAGTNNQFNHLPLADFSREYEQLVKKSVALVNGNTKRVFIISLPNYSVTPFANGQDTGQIAKELGIYNDICKEIALKYQCNFVDITAESTIYNKKLLYLSADNLHPSAKGYSIWVKSITESILASIKD